MKTVYTEEMVNEAYLFALTKHWNQRRKGNNSPYIVHPCDVCSYISKYKNKSRNRNLLMICALLHDTIEDTDTTLEEIIDKFGTEVGDIVLQLTSDKDEAKRIGKTNYLENKMVNMTNYALDVKLCDRLNNISDLGEDYTPVEFRDRYLKETCNIMNYLISNRNINATQKSIIIDIYDTLLELDSYYKDGSCRECLDEVKNNLKLLKKTLFV